MTAHPIPAPRGSRRGLRREAIILLGVVWCLVGAGVLVGASAPPEGLLFLLIPGKVRGTVWIVTGAFAIIAGLRSSRTDWALPGLMVMPMLRLTSYLWGWVTYLTAPPEQGPDRALRFGWFSASFYLAMVGFVLFAAHIPPGMLRRRDSPDADRKGLR